jgi:hypothetical protein
MDYLILALATWRLSSLLTNPEEAGPLGLFDKLRYGVGIRYDADGVRFGLNEVAKALLCLWCTSVWVGGAVTVSYWLAQSLTVWLCLPLALSAGAILFEVKR